MEDAINAKWSPRDFIDAAVGFLQLPVLMGFIHLCVLCGILTAKMPATRKKTTRIVVPVGGGFSEMLGHDSGGFLRALPQGGGSRRLIHHFQFDGPGEMLPRFF